VEIRAIAAKDSVVNALMLLAQIRYQKP